MENWGLDKDLKTIKIKVMVENFIKDLIIIRRAIKELTPMQKCVIKHRWGFSLSEPKILEESGKKFKITRERVRQHEARAIEKMDEYIEKMINENPDNLLTKICKKIK